MWNENKNNFSKKIKKYLLFSNGGGMVSIEPIKTVIPYDQEWTEVDGNVLQRLQNIVDVYIKIIKAADPLESSTRKLVACSARL